MRILITGANGLLGKEISNLAKRDGNIVLETDVNNLNIVSPEEVKKVITEFNPDLIINCAVIPPEKCEENPHSAYQVNVLGVKNLFNHKQKAKLIHFSSPAIFDNYSPLENVHLGVNHEIGYGENHKPNTKSIYGKTKSESERILIDSNSLVIRTSWLYTKDNPIPKINYYASNEINRPTLCEDIWKFIVIALNEDLKGIYNVCGPEIISRYEQARSIRGNKVLGKNLRNVNIRPLSISQIQPILKKHSITLTSWKDFTTKIKN